MFNRGDGQDRINDYSGYAGSSAGMDRIVFGVGIGQGDLVVTRQGNDLVLAIADSSDQITIVNWASGASYHIESFQFSDGTSMTSDQINTLWLTVRGTEGADMDDARGRSMCCHWRQRKVLAEPLPSLAAERVWKALSRIAVMEPRMFGVMEPVSGC